MSIQCTKLFQRNRRVHCLRLDLAAATRAHKMRIYWTNVSTRPLSSIPGFFFLQISLRSLWVDGCAQPLVADYSIDQIDAILPHTLSLSLSLSPVYNNRLRVVYYYSYLKRLLALVSGFGIINGNARNADAVDTQLMTCSVSSFLFFTFFSATSS